MNKITAAIFALALFMFTPTVLRANDVNVNIDGLPVYFNHSPVIVNNRTLVPVLELFWLLDFDMIWNPPLRQVALSRRQGRDMIVITFDSYTFTMNGEVHALEVPAQIIKGRAMLPIRAILESAGFYVGWHHETMTVLVSSTPIEDETVFDYIMIQGVRYGTSLTSLSISSRELNNEDIVLLRYMVNLSGLYLTNNQISDLTPLSSLENLVSLGLGRNHISDIAPLSELTNLNVLWLWSNQISDITPLEGLLNLEVLNLEGNEITNWSPVEHVQSVGGRP